MAESKKNAMRETEIIAWAIPRIAGGHYAISDGANGRELWVTERDPDVAEMTEELLHGRDESVKQAFLALRKDCCFTNVNTVLELVLGERLGGLVGQQFSDIDLTPLHYGLVITVAYKQEKSLIKDIQRIHAKGREGLSNASLARLEQRAIPEAVTVGIVNHYAEEVSKLFPRMILRAEQLRILPAEGTVPPIVQHYIEEASKCYIYGHFIACLVICRSAIEFSIRECLAEQGHKAALGALQDERNDSLWKIIALARSLFPKSLRPTLDDADQIRMTASKAVHKNEPKPEVCKQMFIKTRGVLAELYSSSLGTSYN